MKKISALTVLLLTGCLFLLATNVYDRGKYRHVRTNKKAWVRDATTENDSVRMGQEIYVSEDSVLITSEEPLFNIGITISDHLHGDTEMYDQDYSELSAEERISIIDMPDGVYKITLRDLTASGFLFGYFAKGEQYEAEAEALWEAMSVPAINANGKNGVVYDLSGRQVQSIGKGVYIMDGKKVVIR